MWFLCRLSSRHTGEAYEPPQIQSSIIIPPQIYWTSSTDSFDMVLWICCLWAMLLFSWTPTKTASVMVEPDFPQECNCWTLPLQALEQLWPNPAARDAMSDSKFQSIGCLGKSEVRVRVHWTAAEDLKAYSHCLWDRIGHLKYTVFYIKLQTVDYDFR